MARYPVKRSALLPLLHLVQYQDGYVSDDGIAECAELLDLTKAEVAAVSTFYTMYKREPMGRHLVSICTNFSCAVRGGKEVYDRVSDHLGVGHNETTQDGTITLEHAECLGNCEGAPLISVDYINYEMVEPDAAISLVEGLREGNPAEPTRGMIPPGVREASHRLAAIGPIDPDGPGQRLGLATAEHGAVPQPEAGVGAGGVGIISFGTNGADPTADGAAARPDEVPPPAKNVPITEEPIPGAAGSSAEAEEQTEDAVAAAGGQPDEIAEEAAPSDADPGVQGAEADTDDDADPREEPPGEADSEGAS
ncbi:NAD(P)H-dependent oxidoreductase subunit E [Euzebya tangerina]|uniref:NADH-quinone oxidoreductase subunit NuoE family protein n=1 Tax=Euzebya tangerina TaxID=591198 RepID=UPI00196A4631|nr:NAD(P)H-dependent oxidoreductase subunit E [Euzebya tangerina]